jgi:ABC-type oligopeptide transport system substrate-binding subunit
MAMLFTSDNAVPGGLNISKWRNAEFDALVEEARRTGDVAKQAELYARSAQILNDELPVIFLEQHASLWVQQPPLLDPDGNVGWNGGNWWWKIGKPSGS